jgi:hypothetical protein
MNRSLAALAAALLGLVVLDCTGSTTTPVTLPPQVPSANAPAPAGSGALASVPGLSIQNGTTLEVSLVVNGVVVRKIGPGGCLGCGGGASRPALEPRRPDAVGQGADDAHGARGRRRGDELAGRWGQLPGRRRPRRPVLRASRRLDRATDRRPRTGPRFARRLRTLGDRRRTSGWIVVHSWAWTTAR